MYGHYVHAQCSARIRRSLPNNNVLPSLVCVVTRIRSIMETSFANISASSVESEYVEESNLEDSLRCIEKVIAGWDVVE